MAEPVKFTLNIEQGKEGLWYVSSPEMPGLLLALGALDSLGDCLFEAVDGLATAGDQKAQDVMHADGKEPSQ